MELQALLVLCGVGVAGVAVLLLMGLFTSSGTSYEEAIAQQRKATTELLALAENKNKPKKNSKKAIKKQAKKEKKETAAVATGSEPESEAPAESGVEDEAVAVANKGHVEFRPAVVVDIPRDTPPNVKIRKRGKDPKVKPILLNKEDPSCVSDPAALAPTPTTILNHFEEMHPKDEFELLQSTFAAEKPQEKVEEVVEKKESKPAKPAKVTKTAAPKAAPPHEPVKEEAARERRDSGDAPKEQRKAKKSEKKPEKAVEEVVETVAEEVVPPLNAPQPSELTTEKLLKQAFVMPPAPSPAPTATPPGGKKKKKHEPNVLALMAGDSAGVNVGELVRVVREAALSRTEIQILTDALLNKHHDPLPQHSEWTEGPNDPMQKLKKQLADKEKALADEVEASQALHAKLKELRSTLNAERSRAAAAARAAEEGAAAARAERHTLQTRLQRLLDDNHALAQDKAMLQSKLSAEAEVQAQRVQMEMHIQRLSESEAALVQQIAALQQECAAHALEAGQARCDASTARDTCIMSQQHAADMAQQLQKANCAYAELEQQQLLAVRAEQCAQQELQERIAAMTELQNEMQRLSSRLQAAEANAEKAKEEAEKQRKQMANDLKVLGEKLAARESELAELKALKAAPAHNGLPAASEELKSAEAMAAESAVAALREELSEAQRGARDQREQLATLSAQLHHYRDKNNELRTKNWKVMEALQSAEKALQMKATALPAQDLREAIAKAQEAHYNEVANVLRAVCPSAAPGSAVGREWLQNFADNLKKELLKRQTERQELEKTVSEQELEKRMTEKISAPVATAPPSDERVSELQSQNDQLQRLVDKYKRVIDDTEGVLSRLQQNVSAEERRWAQQLAEKQDELDELRHRTLHQEPLAFAYSCIEKSLPAIMEEMQSKIDSLEAQLSQTKANHNHSFADAERLTEERLMGGLSEKHNLDVCNGPSQVGLEEK